MILMIMIQRVNKVNMKIQKEGEKAIKLIIN
jgi:hypothetical protein